MRRHVGTNFGFNLPNPNGYTWYSVEADYGAYGDHIASLTTCTTRTLTPSLAVAGTGWPAGASLTWNPGSYLLGWEDLPLAGGDDDYQDSILEVSGVTPVPEPATLISGALLLLAFGASTLRIVRKNRAA